LSRTACAVEVHGLARQVRGLEAGLLQHPLQHGLKPPRADVLDRRVGRHRRIGQGLDRIVGEGQGHVLGGQQGLVLTDQIGLRLGQDAFEVVARQGLQLDPDRQPALKLGQQVRRLGDVEGARGDEQHMVGLHRPVFGRDRGALDQRQQVALHPLARHVGAGRPLAGRDLVDLVQEDDALVLGQFQGLLVRLSWSSSLSPSSAISGVVASRTVSLTVLVRPPPILPSISDRFSRPTLPPPGMSSPWIGDAVSASDLDLLVVQFAGPQLLAEAVARRRPGAGPDQGVQDPVLGGPSARARTSPRRRSRTMAMALSTRSRMIWSTSRPT
jgi:hypothetical protein